jgi:hypothetical protein
MNMRDTRDSVATIILLIIGIGVASLVLIFVGVLGGQTYNTVESDIDAIYSSADIVNESFTARNDTWVQLDHAEILNGTIGSATYTWTVLNATGSDNTSAFNLNLTLGTILLTGDSNLNSTTCYATYTYKNYTIRTYVRQGIISSFLAIKQTGAYLPIIALAIIIVLILGLIMGLSGRMGGGKETGYYAGAL